MAANSSSSSSQSSPSHKKSYLKLVPALVSTSAPSLNQFIVDPSSQRILPGETIKKSSDTAALPRTTSTIATASKTGKHFSIIFSSLSSFGTGPWPDVTTVESPSGDGWR